jgi:hypothetical protein
LTVQIRSSGVGSGLIWMTPEVLAIGVPDLEQRCQRRAVRVIKLDQRRETDRAPADGQGPRDVWLARNLCLFGRSTAWAAAERRRCRAAPNAGPWIQSSPPRRRCLVPRATTPSPSGGPVSNAVRAIATASAGTRELSHARDGCRFTDCPMA